MNELDEMCGAARVAGKRRWRWIRLAWLRSTLAVLLLALLTSSVCAAFIDAGVWTLTGVLGGVIVLGIAYPGLSLLGVRGELSFAGTRGREGQPLTVKLQVTNYWPWPVWGVLCDPGCGAAAGQVPGPVGLAVLPGGRASEWQWQFTPELRGRYPLRPAVLLSGFPFGLWKAARTLRVSNTIVVWPRTISVPVVSVGDGSLVDDRAVGRGVGASGDFCGVRPYRRGDSLRLVHWSQTARHDSFIVSERHAPVAPVVQIVVDTDASLPQALGSHGSIAWSVRAAAALLCRLVADGAVVELVAGAAGLGRVANPAAMPDGLTYLALLQPAGQPLALSLARSECRHFRGDLQIVIATASAANGIGPQKRSAARRCWLLLEIRHDDRRHALAAIDEPLLHMHDKSTVTQTSVSSGMTTCHAD